MADTSSAAWRNLALATGSFTLSFAAWGLISAFAPGFRTEFHLTAQATALLVARHVRPGVSTADIEAPLREIAEREAVEAAEAAAAAEKAEEHLWEDLPGDAEPRPDPET